LVAALRMLSRVACAACSRTPGRRRETEPAAEALREDEVAI
jgi:hypothetical protein